jgi:5'-nucleotidase
MKKLIALLAALALLLVAAGGAGARHDDDDDDDGGRGKSRTVDVQVLGLNDFHGQLEFLNPLLTSSGRIGALVGGACAPPACFPSGGVEYLATHVRNLRAENPKNTLFVSAGDLIGATPLLSALFHDEPTIEAFNLMDLDYNGVGNHEFDEGIDELLRMQYGNQRRGGSGGGDDDDDDDDDGGRRSNRNNTGCHPVDGCGDGTPFRGAEFDFLAANVKYLDSGKTIFPAYKIHKFRGGGKVAIIGMTLEGTPTIVTPSGIASVAFLDEAETVNALVPKLRRQGVEAIIVLLHEGGNTSLAGNGAGAAPAQTAINSCVNTTGALPPIVEAMDDEVDIVVTGHTNWAVNCLIDGKVVTGAAAFGRLITDIDFKLDTRKNEILQPISVNNKIVTQDVAKATDMTDLMAHYNVFAGPIAARVIGATTGPILRANNAAGESALGDVIADAQLANTVPAGAQLAFMNPGGIRADIGTTGDLTYGAAFAVQPFSNIVVTMTLTGAQIERVLEQQVFSTPAGATGPPLLQVSNGFTYTWTASAPAGNRVDPASIKLNGTTIGAATDYRVTVNSFLATGGDGFTVLNEGTNRTFGDDDLIALEEYFDANTPPGVSPGPQNRITRLP